MKTLQQHIGIILLAALLVNAPAAAQTNTCIGLVLTTDSTDGVLMPRIVKIIPNSAADAEPDIKVGMYVLKVYDQYCRNTPLNKTIDLINGEEGLPVFVTVSDNKDVFPKHAHIMKRGALR